MKPKKPQHGGTREGSGRHPKHGEPTQYIGLRLPVSLVKAIDAAGKRTDIVIAALRKYL